MPTLRGFCRDEERERAFRVVGYDRSLDLPPGRPLPEYRSCVSCGLVVLSLADVPDSTGLVQTTVARARARGTRSGRGGAGIGSTADRPDGSTWRWDPEDAAAYLLEQLWRLYRTWNPAKLGFLPYAAHWLPRRLDDWVGEVSQGGRRRRLYLRPEETDLDAADDVELAPLLPFSEQRLTELVDDLVPDGANRLAALVEGVSEDACDDRFRALLRLLPDGDRRGPRRVAGEHLPPPPIVAT